MNLVCTVHTTVEGNRYKKEGRGKTRTKTTNEYFEKEICTIVSRLLNRL